MQGIYELFHTGAKTQKSLLQENNFTYKQTVLTIKKHLLPNDTVLDIGCGVGTIALFLASKNHIVKGIDISAKAIATAKKSSSILHLTTATFEKKEFPKEFPHQKFDFIICSEVIEHLGNDTLALQKIYQLLKPRGRAYISTPSQNAPLYKLGLADAFDKRVGHLRRYTLEELESKCEEAKLQIITSEKTEGILRNFLFLNPIAGKSIRFIKFFLVDIVTFIDTALVPVFGESDLVVIVQKR